MEMWIIYLLRVHIQKAGLFSLCWEVSLIFFKKIFLLCFQEELYLVMLDGCLLNRASQWVKNI